MLRKTLMAVFSLIAITGNAQYLTNLNYELSFGDLSNATYNKEAASKTVLDGNYLYHVTYTSGTPTGNFLLVKKHHVDGTPTWEQTYGNLGPITFHHGVDVTVDGSGNVYVTGATEHSTEGYNALVIKYNSSGVQQWAYSHNSAGTNDDYATAIDVDGSGNCYVTGQVDEGAVSDAFVLKLDQNGSFGWANTYDYDGQEDGAVLITYVDANTIEMMAITQDDGNIEELSKVVYNSSGVLQSSNRSSIGVDNMQLRDLKRLSTGSYVACGAVPDVVNGDQDLAVYQFSSTMTTTWSYVYDADGFDDIAHALALDASGNIYATGSVEESLENPVMYSCKLNSSGVMQWNKVHEFPNELKTEGTTLDVMGTKLLIAGNIISNIGQSDLVSVLCKTSDGTDLWRKTYSKGITSMDQAQKAYMISKSSFTVIGTGIGTDKKSFVLGYEVLNENTQTVEVDGDFIIQNQLAVKLWPDVVNTLTTDNENLAFAPFKDVVNSTTFIWLTDSVDSIPWDSIRCRKVFKSFKSTDVSSTGNHGLTVDLPALYCNFVLYFNYDIDEDVLATALSGLDQYFVFAEHDEVGVLCWKPDDPDFVSSLQGSLVPNVTYPDVHIGMDDAWDLEKGAAHIKVGVFDTGIFWAHEDFSKDGSGDKDQSKVVGGYSHTKNEDFLNLKFNHTDNNSGHGTAMAGVIGAISNNATGVAGIAGGDADNNEYGVSLMAFQWNDDNLFGTSMSKLAEYMALGASSGDYQHHVANHSWEGGHSKTLAQGVYAAYLNGTIQSCAAGNNNNEKRNCYPADYDDDLVLQTGYCLAAPRRGWQSNYGFDLDFLAPGTSVVTRSTWIDDLRQYTNTSVIPTDEYASPERSSVATAHASAVAALLLSNWNKETADAQNLVQEDVEYLMQIGAEDMEYVWDANDDETAVSGYDEFTGWGLIKADAALQYLQPLNFDLEHVVTTATGQDVTQIGTDVEIEIETDDCYTDLNSGTYIADVYKVEVSTNHNWSSAYSIHSISSEQPGYWLLNSMSNLWDYNESTQTTSARNGVQFTSGNTPDASGAELVGYFFFIKEKKRAAWGNKTLNLWYPHSSTDDHVLAYSVHLSRGWNLGFQDKPSSQFSIFPNPAQNEVQIESLEAQEELIALRLFDLNGKLVDEVYDINSIHYQYLNKRGFKGMYLIEVMSLKTSKRSKIIFE